MKKMLVVLMIVVCFVSSITAVSFAAEITDAVPATEGVKFVTIQEWMDAKGECGDCMVLVKIQAILNPVLAIAEDETGTVNLFSGNGEDSMIVNFMGDEGLTEGSILVLSNPRWNEFEGTIEMADWTVLRMMPVLSPMKEEAAE